MGVDLFLGPDVLLPRRETELLGYRAVDILGSMQHSPLVVDMCCGSGNLAAGIAHHCPTARIWAADLTDSTVALAQKNIQHHAMADRVLVRQGDLFEAIAADDLAGKLDMVVCNPPYISSSRLANESAHLLKNEPHEAFDGGPYGISILQRLVREAVDYLKPDGWLLFELGAGQERLVTSLLARTKSYDPPSFEGTGTTSQTAVTRRNGVATTSGADV